MTPNYHYLRREFGHPGLPNDPPQSWNGLPEGEKITLIPTPDLPYAANKNGDFMVVRGDGGKCLDQNHEVEKSQDPIAGETRKVRMRQS